MDLFQNQEIKYIKDFKVGDGIECYFKILSVLKKVKRDGGLYLALELMDKTGKIPAKIWDDAETHFKMIQEGEVYKIRGYINEYKTRNEIKIDSIKEVSTDEPGFNISDFIEQASFDTESLFNEMIKITKSNINNRYLLQLIDLFIDKYKESLKIHYGAQKIHHAFPGGLLQHTYSVVKLAIFIANHYSLDTELLVIGALFHDIGKIFEFTIEPTINSTLKGGLIGHIVIGNNIFLELKDKIKDFPEDLSVKIQHMIISHHGEREFGSPELPKIQEAFALSIIDLLDSKISIIKETLEKTETKGLFSDYLKILERRLYIPPKEIDEG